MVLPPEVAALLGAIATWLGKRGYDRYQKDKTDSQNVETLGLSLDSKITPNQSVLLFVSDRVHKLRDELTPHFNRINTDILKLDLRQTQTEKDAAAANLAQANSINQLRDHTDSFNASILAKFEKFENKFDRFLENYYRVDGADRRTKDRE